MKLCEVVTKQQTPEIRQIKRELKRLRIISNSKILLDMSVDVDGDVFIPQLDASIPVQFNHVSSNFYCSHTQITSLRGAPRYVGGNFNCSNTPITSLNSAPEHIGGDFAYYDTPNMRSLHGVDKWIPNIKVGGVFYCDQTHILGLALIEGITHVTLWVKTQNNWADFDISHHDPFQFQEQLLEHGFTEQAQL